MDTRRETHDGTKQDDIADPVKGTEAQTDRPVTPDTPRDQGEAIDRDTQRKRTDDAKGSQR
jgi:hypothetical protein